LVGQVAKRQAVLNPRGTLFEIKRFIGRTWDEVKNEVERAPYEVVRGDDGGVRFMVDGKPYTPEEVSAMILRKMVADASEQLGQPITKAVITVPAYFNNAQREATQNAGKIAGLEVLRIVNEPTAAALAYGLDKKGNETVLVFDLGGGTFDVSVLEVGDGVFEVRSTSGDTHLGGSDFDYAVVNWLADEFQKEYSVDLRKDKQALQRLIEASEKAKIELSGLPETAISLPFIAMDPASNAPLYLEKKLTRAKFEELISPLMARVRGPVEQALKDAKLTKDKIDEVILVGGSTRVPAVNKMVKELLGKDPNQTVNPDEVVALGLTAPSGEVARDGAVACEIQVRLAGRDAERAAPGAPGRDRQGDAEEVIAEAAGGLGEGRGAGEGGAGIPGQGRGEAGIAGEIVAGRLGVGRDDDEPGVVVRRVARAHEEGVAQRVRARGDPGTARRAATQLDRGRLVTAERDPQPFGVGRQGELVVVVRARGEHVTGDRRRGERAGVAGAALERGERELEPGGLGRDRRRRRGLTEACGQDEGEERERRQMARQRAHGVSPQVIAVADNDADCSDARGVAQGGGRVPTLRVVVDSSAPLFGRRQRGRRRAQGEGGGGRGRGKDELEGAPCLRGRLRGACVAERRGAPRGGGSRENRAAERAPAGGQPKTLTRFLPASLAA
jgi:Ethanolamine utilization protein EutJ (predicted chaperonin)